MKTRGILSLPEQYVETMNIDFVNDKKLFLIINIISVILALVLAVFGAFNMPFSIGVSRYVPFVVVPLYLLFLMVLYFVFHELIHGFFMKSFSSAKVKYGFTGAYAYAGSEGYFNKRQYIIISLAPVVFHGILFLLLNIFLPREWFWDVYLIQIINLSGAAGDFYMTHLMRKLPKDILVKDAGTSMIIYGKQVS
jgi:hypothetical protein